MIISEALVQLNLQATTKEDALSQLAKAAANNGKINDEATYIEAVLKRESEFSTAVGFGIAIPHGKSDAVNEPFFMFAKVDNIDWNSMDGEPVDLIFLIGVPMSDASSTHLKILASLSRKLMKEPFRNTLRNAKTPKEIIEFLESSELGI
jgi:PTS system fructose-specific IIA component